MLVFALVILALTLAAGLDLLLGIRRLARLADCPPADPARPLRVSIIVAARDEARQIEAAARSLLSQTHRAFELVFVDDRSTDGTGAILDGLARADSRIRVVHVTELPAGWLGKNHALQAGVAGTQGEWLLFTDADIHLHPEALSRALGYAVENQVDHLAALPAMILPGVLLKAFAAHFAYSFLLFARPWMARDRTSRSFVGIGAFNLVRRAAYQAVGGHASIALRPDDDMKLGKILKRAGYRQDAVLGTGMLQVEWYHSLRELVRGLEKNMFAGVDYNPVVSVLGGLAQLVGGVVPLVLVGLAGGLAQAALAAQILVTILLVAGTARSVRISPWVAVLNPLVVLVFVSILWRTMVVNLRRGGITWRGTFYPLDLLKANRV